VYLLIVALELEPGKSLRDGERLMCGAPKFVPVERVVGSLVA
jgi:hypothetical protein